MQPATPSLFEQLIYSRPYFDPAGLIIALFNDLPVGFAHAGFGANEDETAVSYDIGTTYQLVIRSDHHDGPLARELLAQSENYLRERGAKVIYAGGIRPLNAFYLGLYGGNEGEPQRDQLHRKLLDAGSKPRHEQWWTRQRPAMDQQRSVQWIGRRRRRRRWFVRADVE